METILRVAGRCAGLSGAAFADCIAYFYGVARNVDRERVRGERRELTNREAAAKDPTRARAVDPLASRTKTPIIGVWTSAWPRCRPRRGA